MNTPQWSCCEFIFWRLWCVLVGSSEATAKPQESALVLHVFDPVTGTLICVPAPATGTPSATGKSNFDPITGKITFFGKRLD